MKSDRSVVVLHHFGLGRAIGFQAALSETHLGRDETQRCRNVGGGGVNYAQLTPPVRQDKTVLSVSCLAYTTRPG